MIKANCVTCNIAYEYNPNQRRGKYCSNLCSQEGRRKSTTLLWLSGEHKGWTGKTRQLSGFVRAHLHDVRGSACEECGWDEKHPIDGAILTEIDHIDGNAENCSILNLRVLCPNCHSMTSTFRARNKDSKRQR